ncbi:signal peptidase I [Patescibacteria group bacterium]|nr:MAG: signal peptidase I [Patescibacteria group bacterium]
MIDSSEEKISRNSEPEPKKQKGFFRELLELLIVALVVVVPFRLFIAQPFVVNGASMEPTFDNGEYLIVDQLTYRFEPPERGEVLIFRFPKDPKKFFIKRLIGLPGETVTISNGRVYIKNSEHPEGFAISEPYVSFIKRDNFTVTLEESEFFVLGDNRLGSADSRLWGPLPVSLVVGRPIIRLFPFTRIALLPGDGSKTLREQQ